MPFKNTKIRPAENTPRVEVGSSNPRWSTRAGSSWVVRAGRPTRGGLPALGRPVSSWVVRACRPTRGGLPVLGHPASFWVIRAGRPTRGGLSGLICL
ncbi:hypothetical protein DY000_02029249 [Brassica cretica]|uniref:Uncharacterized protein n=1 Tax=Brassica cretica TaxID=69181 RepID=A0ABQ7DB50_BRACR|nr:hypothetical protein DY000_02029249 [Brassica cretica]